MNTFLKLTLFIFFSVSAFGQTNRSVVDLSLKLASLKSEEMYFAFAAGDRIVLTVIEEGGKEISEVEVLEYPNLKRFSERKTSGIVEKEIYVSQNTVYMFRIANNTVSRRNCKVKISRIPASSETSSFNTSVDWITVNDTTWKQESREGIIRYDTTYINNTKRGVVSKKVVEEFVLDKNQRVFSWSNLKNRKSAISFSLPKNQSSENEEKVLVSWAYWIGVDEAGNKAWEQNSKIITGIVKGGASVFMSPLGALAVGVVADLSVPTMGEDVEYWLADNTNTTLFNSGKDFKFLDHGRGVAGYHKFSASQNRDFNLLLKNDNLIQGIDVNVKVTAIFELRELGNITTKEAQIKPIKGRIRENIPIVKTVKKPVVKN